MDTISGYSLADNRLLYIVLGVSASQREQELQDQLQMLRKELKEMQRRILVMLEMLGESA